MSSPTPSNNEGSVRIATNIEAGLKIGPQTILATMGHLNIALISAKPFFPHDTKWWCGKL